MPTIGILHSGDQNQQGNITIFKDELADWLQGTGVNVTYDPTGVLWSNNDPDLLDTNADTLATNPNLDLIIAAGGTATVYAVLGAQTRARTSTNVVFTTFSQTQTPAANMCGVCAHTSDKDVERLKRLHAKVKAQRYGVLENRFRPDYDAAKLDNWGNSVTPRVTLNHQFVKNSRRDMQFTQNITDAFTAWRNERGHPTITAALVCADPVFNAHRRTIKRAAKPTDGRRKIKTMHQWLNFKSGGYGDWAYGTFIEKAYEMAAECAMKILVRRESPAQVGVVETTPVPTTFLHTVKWMLSAIFPSRRARRR